MLNTRLSIVSIALVSLVTVNSEVSFAADRGEARTPADVSGKITAISPDGKTLNLESGGGRGVEPTKNEVKLNEKTKIEFPALKDTTRKFKVGDSVSAWLKNGAAELIEVSAAPDVSGSVTAVSGDGKVVTVETQTVSNKRGEAPTKSEVKIQVTDKTKFLASRDPNEDVKPQVGHHISVWLEDGTKDSAVAIQSRKPGAGGARR